MNPISSYQASIEARAAQAKEAVKTIRGMMAYTYGDQNNPNPFDRHVTEIFQTYASLQMTSIDPSAERETMVSWIQQKNASSPLPFLESAERCKRCFPVTFNECKGQEAIDFLKAAILNPYSISEMEPPKEEYAISGRKPSDFKGDTLVFGCGWSCTTCHGHNEKKEYLVDMAEGMKPDLTADFYSHAFWKEFKNGQFSHVDFEDFHPTVDSDFLSEISRILKKNGDVAILKTPFLSLVHDKHPEEFETFVKKCGFASFELAENSRFLLRK
jgi:hypothetical protein